MVDKKELINEMVRNQHVVLEKKYRLEHSDIERISKYIDDSIFQTSRCVKWSGYLTKCNGGKSQYVNFFIKGKKLAIHRILYINFVGDLSTTQYLKYTCDNPGCCCNINHFYRIDGGLIEEPVLEVCLPVAPKHNVQTDSQHIKNQLKILFSD